MALKITDSNFDELINGQLPVVVDFWAEWCGPCRAIIPHIEALADEYAGQVVIGKLNVDENDASCEKYGIRNIPTILFFKNGEIIDKQVGAISKDVLAKKVAELL